MSEVNFKIGDIVNLKSGGPDMTISGIDSGWIECTYWNKETKKFDSITLDPGTLDLAE